MRYNLVNQNKKFRKVVPKNRLYKSFTDDYCMVVYIVVSMTRN